VTAKEQPPVDPAAAPPVAPEFRCGFGPLRSRVVRWFLLQKLLEGAGFSCTRVGQRWCINLFARWATRPQRTIASGFKRIPMWGLLGDEGRMGLSRPSARHQEWADLGARGDRL